MSEDAVAEKRAEVNKTQSAAQVAANAAHEATADAKEAVDEAKGAVKDYWKARDEQLAAGYRVLQARRRRKA